MKKLNLLLISAMVLGTTVVHASIKLGNNRLIYDGSKPDATMTLDNDDTRAFLVQAWADVKGNPLLEGKTVPFMVTPPLFQMAPGAENLVQLFYLGSGLPSDRESLLWMNIKSVPAIKDSEKGINNKMLLAVSNRIKVFYRPVGLNMSSTQAIDSLKWQKGDENTVVASNKSPFYVVMNKVIINGKSVAVSIEDNNTVVPPFGEKKFTVNGIHKQMVAVTWSALNDYSLPTKDYSAQVHW